MIGAGRLFPFGKTLVIETNRLHSSGKQNFTASHEVGHILMPTYSRESKEDSETGGYSGTNEEEILCDFAAAALLLEPNSLRRYMMDLPPTIFSLQRISEMYVASLEATARQLAGLGVWRCCFVFWEPGFRKADRVSKDQQSIPGFESFGAPKPKLRVKTAYRSPNFGYFVPQNKSAPVGSTIELCGEVTGFTFGNESIEFERGRQNEFYCESMYAPYIRGGDIHKRVITMLLPTIEEATSTAVQYQYELEVL
jgi:hypothetical protein